MKYFGTDGFRGEAGRVLTVEHAYKIGRFVGWYYGARLERRARVIVGKDTRRSSYMLESGIVAGLVASGADAYLLHVIPTPGVAYETVDGRFDCGIMISASHNPYTDNGIKLVNGEGYKMDEDVLERIEDYIDGNCEVPFAVGDAIGCTIDYMQGRNRYIAHLIASANFSLQGVRVGLDCANGSASSVAKPVFDALGAEVHVINNVPDGLNINVDCGSTHMDRLRRFVVEHGRLAGGTVVPTVMSNLGLFKALDDAKLSYEVTAVGDKNVYACMREKGYSLGGEQSGHIIFGDIECTGDGIMTSLRIMEVIRAERETLSALCAPMKVYPQVLVNVRSEHKEDLDGCEAVWAAVRAAEEELGDKGRVLVRTSGTEPLIRVMAEAETERAAQDAVDGIVSVVKRELP